MWSALYMRFSGLPPITKQLAKFTLIGMLAVMVDMSVYYIMLHVYPEMLFNLVSNEVMAKTTSFLIGMNVTYYLNKLWTWKKNDRPGIRIFKFYFLYGISMVLNVTANSLLLFMLQTYKVFTDLPFKYLIAFMGATVTTAVFNFAGQKFWIFKIQMPEVTE